jgi:hypothetical protein
MFKPHSPACGGSQYRVYIDTFEYVTNVSTKLAKLKADASRFGWGRSLLNRFFRVAAQYLGIHVHVVRISEMADDRKYPSELPGIAYRLIETEELYAASADPEMDLSQKFVERGIERGDLAFGAFDGPLLVSFVWRAEAAAPHDHDIWVRVKSPYCYAYKSFTRPSHRGQHISPGVHICSDAEMAKRGYQYRAGFVEVSNWRSLAMGKHMASRIIGYAGYAQWFGKCIPFRTRAVKAIGFEFFDRNSTHSVN